jgi:LacI family transcriptional regulator
MDAPDISVDTKNKIRRIANDMGYVYNRTAATLRGGKSRTIGILFDSLLNPFYYIMTNYIWGRLQQEDYNIITFKNDNLTFNDGMARQILSYHVDGILSFLEPTKEAVTTINNNKVPLVLLGRDAHRACDNVFLDDAIGGRMAARHFVELGCEKPLYIGESEELECSVKRSQGFVEEWRLHGVKATVQFVESQEEHKYANSFLKSYQKEKPDCVFCFSDMIAYEVLSAMQQNKITDVKLCGFDNIQNEIYMPCGLTSVSYHKQELANIAVDYLLNSIKNKTCGTDLQTILSDFEVVVANT